MGLARRTGCRAAGALTVGFAVSCAFGCLLGFALAKFGPRPDILARPSAADADGLAPALLMVEPYGPRFQATAEAADGPAAADEAPAPAGRLAIVIDDLGADVAAARAFIAFPADLTLAFLPYAGATPVLSREAAEAGRTVLIHMPMEPLGAADPGPGALRAGDDAQTVRAHIEKAHERVSAARGLNNHMGSLATADAALMGEVAGVLKERGLFFLDSLTTPESRGIEAARAAGVEHYRRDVFLDNRADVAATLAQLRRAEALARRFGRAVAIGHPYPETLEALALWREEKGADVSVVPIDALGDASEEALNPPPVSD